MGERNHLHQVIFTDNIIPKKSDLDGRSFYFITPSCTRLSHESASRVRSLVALHPSASLYPLSCALGALSAPISLHLMPPGCTRGHFCSQVPRQCASRVRSLVALHPSASRNPLSCALEALSAPISLHLKPPVCTRGSFCSQVHRQCASRVRILVALPPSASLYPLSCALGALSAPISLHLTPPVCTRGRLRSPEPVVVAEDNWLRPGTAFGLSFPALSAGPLPLPSRGRLRPPGASCHSAPSCTFAINFYL